jgi:hypothetical protein
MEQRFNELYFRDAIINLQDDLVTILFASDQ